MKKGLLVAVLVSVLAFCGLSFAANTVPSTMGGTMSSTDTNSDGSSMSTTTDADGSNSTMNSSS